jgi:hypothetical protein
LRGNILRAFDVDLRKIKARKIKTFTMNNLHKKSVDSSLKSVEV